MAAAKQNCNDRFSDLPNEIVYQILSHLPIKTLARLSTLSKRCRELCKSNPNPTLLFSSWDASDEESSRRGLCNSLDRVMALRSLYKVKTQCFRVKWIFEPTFEDEEDRVWAWLEHAVNSGVEDICIEFDHLKPFTLPPSVLGCKSLRSLKIEAYFKPFRLPSSLSVPSFADKLQVFVLRGLNTDNQSLGE